MIETEETKSFLYTSPIHSQQNTLEHVKFAFGNEHEQQIEQLLSTNSIRRQRMICNDRSASRDHLVVSEEKDKQSMITIVQLSSLLQQTQSMATPTSNSNDSVNKKKFTLNKLNTLNIPFTLLSRQANRLKDCHIMNIDTNGRIKEPTVVLQPQWLANQQQTKLALLTADFIKIYDLSVDTSSPMSYFILPTDKVRDCIFYYTRRNNQP